VEYYSATEYAVRITSNSADEVKADGRRRMRSRVGALLLTVFKMTDVGSTLPRVYRYVVEHKKLTAKVTAVASAHGSVIRHYRDPLVESLQHKAGFEPHDLVGWQIWTKTGSFTVIFVPLRLWYRSNWKRRALELKCFLRARGKRCIISPASFVDRQPRLQNAKFIATCARFHVTATDRLNVLAALDEFHSLSIIEAAGLVHGSDPAAALLGLVHQGALALDPDKPIGPHTLLRVRC
jgi:hypothetical protein